MHYPCVSNFMAISWAHFILRIVVLPLLAVNQVYEKLWQQIWLLASLISSSCYIGSARISVVRDAAIIRADHRSQQAQAVAASASSGYS